MFGGKDTNNFAKYSPEVLKFYYSAAYFIGVFACPRLCQHAVLAVFGWRVLSNLTQGQHHKGAFSHARVGQGESWFLHHEVVVGQQVYVYAAVVIRSVYAFACSSQFALYLLRSFEALARRETGADAGAGVQEEVAGREAYRLVLHIPRHSLHLTYPLANEPDGLVYRRPSVAKVGTKRYI